MPERYCDCPRCPCHVPITGRHGKDCADCRIGNHMDWLTAARAVESEEPAWLRELEEEAC